MDPGGPTVELGGQGKARKITVEAVVGPGRDRVAAGGVDELPDILAKNSHGNRARGLEIILGGQVVVLRDLRLQARVARGHRLVVVIDVRPGDELADAGPANVLGVAESGDELGDRREFEMHAREDIGVVAGAFLAAGKLLVVPAGDFGVGERAHKRGAAGPLRHRDHLQRTLARHLGPL